MSREAVNVCKDQLRDSRRSYGSWIADAMKIITIRNGFPAPRGR